MAAFTNQEPVPWVRSALVAPWREIVLVLLVFVGPFAVKSAWAAGHGSSRHFVSFLLSDSMLLSNGAVESGLLALFLSFLYWRRWVGADFHIRVSGRATLQGLGLSILMMFANSFAVFGTLILVYALQNRHVGFFPYLLADSPHLVPHSVHVGWAVLLGAMILNAYFEELLCIGYAFNQFAAKLGPFAALLLTTLLRMSCHTYQGPVHMLGIGAVFFVTGLWYGRTRNLWPLIFSHALVDIASTGFIKVLFS